MDIGSARVSTDEQPLNLQLNALAKADSPGVTTADRALRDRLATDIQAITDRGSIVVHGVSLAVDEATR